VVVKDEFVGTATASRPDLPLVAGARPGPARGAPSPSRARRRDRADRWTLVRFSNSDRYDRHFTLDTATGEIAFGPAIRQPDGSVRQYGRVPEAGRQIGFTQYRHGGGVAGNVPAGRIQMLKSAVPYIDSVTNLRRAEGGRDQETLDEAKLRARREVRAQQRAVRRRLACRKATSRSVAVKCLTPARPPPMAAAANLPRHVGTAGGAAVFDALRNGDLTKRAR
jgi:predicted phage baseplate assembly protein